MRITLEIPDGAVCAILTYVESTKFGSMHLASSTLDTEDLRDGNEIKLPRREEQ